MINSSIWPIDGTVTGTTILSNSRPESNSIEGVLHIPQNFKTETSTSDFLVSYQEYLW